MEIDQEAFDTFWYWVNERYAIALRRAAGQEKPWSEDPIFQEWKFCNVFRTDDKQTQALLGHLSPKHIDRPKTKRDLELLLFNIYAFRAFNWDPTYCNLVKDIPAGKRTTRDGWLEDWSTTMGQDSCLDTLQTNHQLTSGAYMIRGRDNQPKSLSIPATLSVIWDRVPYLANAIQDEPVTTMEEMYDLLRVQNFYGWGPFTTYQIVLDLTYTYVLGGSSDINTWCMFGPGAKRGLNLVFPGIRSKDYLPATKELWETQKSHRQLHVPFMSLQDIEFSLCELSKYMRIKRGGKSKEKYPGLA